MVCTAISQLNGIVETVMMKQEMGSIGAIGDAVIAVAEESWSKLGGMDDRAEVHGSSGVAYADLLHGRLR